MAASSEEDAVVLIEPPSIAPEDAVIRNLPVQQIEEGEEEIVLNPSNKSPSASESSDGGAEQGAGISYSPKRSVRSRSKAPPLVANLTQLSEAYARDPNLDAETIQQLVESTGLTEHHVSTFFANKRARDVKAAPMAVTVAPTPSPAVVAPSSQVDESLSQITNEDGGLADPEHAAQLVKLMQLPLFMDDQFLILAVILATKSFQCRKRFLELGGLPPICEWLMVAKKDAKVPLQKELLRVLECLPIKVELLRATSAGKVVKSLKTSSDPDVRLRADRLVSAWMSMVAAVDTAPQAVNTWSSSDAVAVAPTPKPDPGADSDASKKRAPSFSFSSIPTSISSTSNSTSSASIPSSVAPKPSTSVAKRPKLDEPPKKPTAAVSLVATKPKPVAEVQRPKTVAASTTLAVNDDFDVLAKKKSIVPDHLKKPARTALLFEGDEKKKDEGTAVTKPKDIALPSKPISADEIRKEKQRQKALGVTSSEPKLESKPGHGAAAAAHLGKIVAAVASGVPLTLPPSDAGATTSSSSFAAAALTGPPSTNPFLPAAAPSTPPVIVDDPLPVATLGKNGKPKKKLVWSDTKGLPLKRVKTFVKDKPDKAERLEAAGQVALPVGAGASANNNKDFSKAAHMEHAREKENLLKDKKAHTMDLKVTIAWRRPRALQLPAELLQPIAETGEVKLQLERERSILSDMLPFKADRTVDMSRIRDNPVEAENEPLNDDLQALLIPVDEQQAATQAATQSLPQMLNLSGLANLQSVLAQMPGATVPAAVAPTPMSVSIVPSSVPQVLSAHQMAAMDPALLAQALPLLASLVSGQGPGGVPVMPYFNPNPSQSFYGGTNAPLPVRGGERGYGGRERDGRDSRDSRGDRERDGGRDNRDSRDRRGDRDRGERDGREGEIPPEQLEARRHIMCQYFLKGDCKYGARCHFSHNVSEEEIAKHKRKRSGR